MKKRFRKILIANRGEIALRIIRAAKADGTMVAAIYTDEEKFSAHVLHADEAYLLGSGQLSDTYLNVSLIVRIALDCQAEAVHPGYGFLSENPDLASACERAGLVFIGPSVKVLSLMGNKIKAKEAARNAGLPVLESIYTNRGRFPERGVDLHFPLLVKACYGGGGKGMHVVHSPLELSEKLEQSARAAANFFGNDETYLEPYILHARHVEVQLMGDRHGNIVHLFERDCTLQRNHQKIIEEAPAAFLDEQTRQSLLYAALKLGRYIGYENAGTVEFLVEPSGKYYFMEMNPRIQVEHTVTEAITGIDLVREQLSVAAGNPLSFSQNEISTKGHALQARVYTEDALNGFRPSTSAWSFYKFPDQGNVRVETDLLEKSVPVNRYEPLAAKLIVHAAYRDLAIRELLQALDDTVLLGPETNLDYLKAILLSKSFWANTTTTRYLEENHETLKANIVDGRNKSDRRFVLAAFVLFHHISATSKYKTVWEELGRWRMHPQFEVQIGESVVSVCYRISENILWVEGREFKFQARFERRSPHQYLISIEDRREVVFVALKNDEGTLIHSGGQVTMVKSTQLEQHHPVFLHGSEMSEQQQGDIVVSPLHGRIVRIAIEQQQVVALHDLLLVIESMKSENQILAHKKGKIKKILGKIGDQVTDGMPLIIIEDQ